MNNVILMAALMCAKPVIIDSTKTKWTSNDQWVYETAVRRCPMKYDNSPCLKTFIKHGYQSYHAICGAAIGE